MAPLVTLERAQTYADVSGSSAPLRRVGHAVPTADGGFLVADTASMRILRVNRVGRTAATMGTQGIGPGQMQSITAIASHADTIFVFDAQLWRITAFDSLGVLLFTRRAEPRAVAPAAAVRTADGSWLVLEAPEPAATDSAAVGVVRWSASGNTWIPVARTPAAQTSSGEARGHAARWTAQSNGDFWYADAEHYAIARYSATGESLSNIAVSSDQHPREIRVSGVGELWVRIDASSDSVEWHAFDTLGEMRYRVRLPQGVQLRAISGDTLIVAGREPAGSVYIARFVVRR